MNLNTPGTFYPGRNRQLDLTFKKIVRFGGQRLMGGLDIYNVMNENTILFYNDVQSRRDRCGRRSPT